MAATGETIQELADRALEERLSAFPGYSRLVGDARARLVEIGAPRRYHPGDRLLEQGQIGRSLFIVLAGRLKISRDLANGRTVLLGFFGPGETVGLTGLGGQTSTTTVEALESSRCLEIACSELISAMEQRPQLIGQLLPALTERVAECSNCLIEGSFFRIEPRLARLFLKLAEAVGRPLDEGTFVPIPLSRQDLADMAGTTIETAIRVMSRWSKEGVIETRREGFVVRDRPALLGLFGG